MGNIIIKDPLTSQSARVEKSGKICVSAATTTEFNAAAYAGHAYDIEMSSPLTLTGSSVETGILYIKNTYPNSILFLQSVFLLLGASTGGTGEFVNFSYYKNPTGGTLVSDGTDMTSNNRLIGSGNVADGIFKENTGAQTFTGATKLFDVELILGSSPQRFAHTADILIGSNQSLVVAYTTPPSNTSQDVKVGAKFFYVPVDPFAGF